MKIKFTSIMVDNQENALKFYTEILGFKKCADISMGEYRWLTVTSPEGIQDIELVLEPIAFPPAKVYQKELFDAGIPIASFVTDDINQEYKRLENLSVIFKSEPINQGVVITAIFEDTCGNLINLAQPIKKEK